MFAAATVRGATAVAVALTAFLVAQSATPSVLTAIAATPTTLTAHEAVATDGTVWATDPTRDQLVGLTPAGAIKRVALPVGSRPVGIVQGGDGAMWFTESGADLIGRLGSGGDVTTFTIPTPNAQPWGITTMPGDLLAITERAAGKLAIAKPDGGVVGEIPVGNGTTQPAGITTGADGALYFTEAATGVVARYARETVTEFALPTSTSYPTDIAAGPDGALWVSETGAARVARVTTTGAITEVALPASAAPAQLASGPDGAIWVAEPGVLKVARISGLQPATSLAAPTLSVTQRSTSGAMAALAVPADGSLVVASTSTVTPTRTKGVVTTATPCIAGPICIGVNARQPGGPVTHVADGIVHSAANPAPDPGLVDALHPTSWRISSLAEYPAAARSGAVITYLLSDGWYNGTYGLSSLDPTGQVPPYANPDGYTNYVESAVRAAITAGDHVDYWEIQNEPDAACCGTINQQLWMYKLGYDAVKAVDPTAKVMGPSLASFFDRPDPNDAALAGEPSLDLKTFLQHAVDNGEQWDALSWHENNADINSTPNAVDTPNVVVDHIRRARALIAQFPQAGNPLLVVNEYGGPGQTQPGFLVGSQSALEASGVGLASMACWGTTDAAGTYSTCREGAMDDLLERGGAQPAANFWVQKAYADMSGRQVAVQTSDPQITGVAATDGSGLSVLIGKHGGCHPLGRVCTNAAATAAAQRTVVSVRMPLAKTSYVIRESVIQPGVDAAPTVITHTVTSNAKGNLVAIDRTLADGVADSVTITLS